MIPESLQWSLGFGEKSAQCTRVLCRSGNPTSFNNRLARVDHQLHQNFNGFTRNREFAFGLDGCRSTEDVLFLRGGGRIPGTAEDALDRFTAAALPLRARTNCAQSPRAGLSAPLPVSRARILREVLRRDTSRSLSLVLISICSKQPEVSVTRSEHAPWCPSCVLNFSTSLQGLDA